jgi:CBS-domain-containing membrane protein
MTMPDDDSGRRSSVRLGQTKGRLLSKVAETIVKPTAIVQDMTRLFLKYPVRYLYVTDDAECLLGVVALKDITSEERVYESRFYSSRPMFAALP